jgi:hypothetical protein
LGANTLKVQSNLLVFFLLPSLVLLSLFFMLATVAHTQRPEPIPTPPPPKDGTPLPLNSSNMATAVNTDTFTINILAYLYPEIDESEYISFIDNISAYYQGQGLEMQFFVNELIQLNPGEECGWSRGVNDMINCVGPDMGGYYGPPWYRIGLNTDDPYGFDTNWGLHAAAHEFGHFLTIQDFYWLQTAPTSPVQAPNIPWPNEIMVDPYLPNPSFSVESKRIIEENIERIGTGGVDNMLFVADRMVPSVKVFTPQANETCTVYARERDFVYFRSKIDDTPAFTKTTDPQQSFTFTTTDGSNPDNNFDLFYLNCVSGEYWIHSRLVEDFYFDVASNMEDPIPDIICQNNREWCVYDIEDQNFYTFLPTILR